MSGNFLSRTVTPVPRSLSIVQTSELPPLVTKFMGSKAAILDQLFLNIDRFEYDTVLDAFSGSGVVAYEFKKRIKQVATNDMLNFSFETCRAVIENNEQKLGQNDIEKLIKLRKDGPTKIRDHYVSIYFTYEECYFLDSLWLNISEIQISEYSKSLAIAAACRACQKRYPRGIFTTVGGRGRDDRKDFKIGLVEHFKNAVDLFNRSVFSNGKKNRAFNGDIFERQIPASFDLVYLDPPYWSPFADNDYVRRYHFIEGYSKYWEGLPINEKTKTKKFDSSHYPTPFSKRETARKALEQLFQIFSESIVVLSYSSNSLPSLSEIRSMIKKSKKNVEVHAIPHRYSFANQRAVPSKIRNQVDEYVFLGYDDHQKPKKG
jgi:DNA adenine methylase